LQRRPGDSFHQRIVRCSNDNYLISTEILLQAQNESNLLLAHLSRPRSSLINWRGSSAPALIPATRSWHLIRRQLAQQVHEYLWNVLVSLEWSNSWNRSICPTGGHWSGLSDGQEKCGLTTVRCVYDCSPGPIVQRLGQWTVLRAQRGSEGDTYPIDPISAMTKYEYMANFPAKDQLHRTISRLHRNRSRLGAPVAAPLASNAWLWLITQGATPVIHV
jgi:hypothetical protein